MGGSTNIGTMDLEVLFEKLNKLLDILRTSNEENLFENLSDFDEVYFELSSRTLNSTYFDILEDADEKKEKVLERFEDEVNKKLDENMSASEKTDVGTEEGKKLFIELNAQWSELSAFQNKLVGYRISSTKRGLEITKVKFKELKESANK